MSPIALLFWLSLTGIAYIFAGYPLLVWCASKFGSARDLSDYDDATSDGAITILIVAHAEVDRLPVKLDSVFACDGADRIDRVLVGLDAPPPEMVAAVEAYARDKDPRVEAHPFEEQRGKAAVLADLVPLATGDLVVFNDARQELHPGALTALSARFADPSVGVVSGELVFRGGDSTAAEGVGFYWTYEKFLRKCEANFRGVPGATGALYAVRREYLEPPLPGTILDDVVIPMLAVEQGVRCVFEPNAVVYDAPAESTAKEAVRKRRTIAGAAQLVVDQPRWLLPRALFQSGNPIWWEFVSHKLARLVAPLLLVVVAVTNVVLALTAGPVYVALLVGQVVFYAAALAGWVAQRSGRKLKPCAAPLMFVTLNATTALALWDASRGRFSGAWRAER